MEHSVIRCVAPCILFDMSHWGDVNFFTDWVSACATATALWRQGAKDDPTVYSTIGTLMRVENSGMIDRLDFRHDALTLICAMNERDQLRLESHLGCSFAMLFALGMFKYDGERFEMTIPTTQDVESVKRSVLQCLESGASGLLPEGVPTLPYFDAARARRKTLH